MASSSEKLTYVLHFLHHIPFGHDRGGQQERIVLDARQQRRRHPHLILEAQVQPRQVLRRVQQIAAGAHDAVQQLHHHRFALSLIGERFDVVRHLLAHRLDDFRRHQHVAAVQRFAARHLRQIGGDADQRRVALVDAHLEAVQPEAATVRQIGRGRQPDDDGGGGGGSRAGGRG